MTATSIVFFLFGAIVLWGGLIVTLTIAIKGKNFKKGEDSDEEEDEG